MGYGITIRIRRFLIQTPLGAWSDLGTQPCYNWQTTLTQPSDIWVEVIKMTQRLAQSWLWGNQIALTKVTKSVIFLHNSEHVENHCPLELNERAIVGGLKNLMLWLSNLIEVKLKTVVPTLNINMHKRWLELFKAIPAKMIF